MSAGEEQQPVPTQWSSSIVSYTIGDLECLQQWIKANPQSVMIGLLCFFKDKRMQPCCDETLSLWGPLAEQMFNGRDVVAEHRAKAGETNWTTTPNG